MGVTVACVWWPKALWHCPFSLPFSPLVPTTRKTNKQTNKQTIKHKQSNKQKLRVFVSHTHTRAGPMWQASCCEAWTGHRLSGFFFHAAASDFWRGFAFAPFEPFAFASPSHRACEKATHRAIAGSRREQIAVGAPAHVVDSGMVTLQASKQLPTFVPNLRAIAPKRTHANTHTATARHTHRHTHSRAELHE